MLVNAKRTWLSNHCIRDAFVYFVWFSCYFFFTLLLVPWLSIVLLYCTGSKREDKRIMLTYIFLWWYIMLYASFTHTHKQLEVITVTCHESHCMDTGHNVDKINRNNSYNNKTVQIFSFSFFVVCRLKKTVLKTNKKLEKTVTI